MDSNFSNNSTEDQGKPSKAGNVLAALFILYFVGKAGFFALRIREKIFPDETTWLGICEVFSRNVFLPADSAETYHLGLLTHLPNFYFFLMGKLLTLNVFGLSDLIFLRLVNVLFGAVSLYFAWKTIARLVKGLVPRLLVLVFLTNTMMLTFMSGAINNDNLATMFAVLGFYLLVRYLQINSSTTLLLLLITLGAGLLSKITFLPYTAVLVIALAWLQKKTLLSNLADLFHDFPAQRWLHKALIGFAILIWIPVVLLYAGNLVQFKTLTPSMNQVLPLEASLQYRLFARGYALNFYKGGGDIVDAQRIALQIRNPGDRADAWNLLIQAQRDKQKTETQRLGPISYLKEWAQYMATRLYGVAAHLVLEKTTFELLPYYAFTVLALFLGLFRRRIFASPDQKSGLWVGLGYLMVLIWVVNYRNYLASGAVGLVLSGRYLFPVLVPLYIGAVLALFEDMPKWWQWSAGSIFAALFVIGEFPWFLQKATPAWFF